VDGYYFGGEGNLNIVYYTSYMQYTFYPNGDIQFDPKFIPQKYVFDSGYRTDEPPGQGNNFTKELIELFKKNSANTAKTSKFGSAEFDALQRECDSLRAENGSVYYSEEVSSIPTKTDQDRMNIMMGLVARDKFIDRLEEVKLIFSMDDDMKGLIPFLDEAKEKLEKTQHVHYREFAADFDKYLCEYIDSNKQLFDIHNLHPDKKDLLKALGIRILQKSASYLKLLCRDCFEDLCFPKVIDHGVNVTLEMIEEFFLTLEKIHKMKQRINNELLSSML
jgi:hypothetical protein